MVCVPHCTGGSFAQLMWCSCSVCASIELQAKRLKCRVPGPCPDMSSLALTAVAKARIWCAGVRRHRKAVAEGRPAATGRRRHHAGRSAAGREEVGLLLGAWTLGSGGVSCRAAHQYSSAPQHQQATSGRSAEAAGGMRRAGTARCLYAFVTLDTELVRRFALLRSMNTQAFLVVERFTGLCSI